MCPTIGQNPDAPLSSAGREASPCKKENIETPTFFIGSWIVEGYHYCPDDDPQQIHISIFVSSVLPSTSGSIYINADCFVVPCSA